MAITTADAFTMEEGEDAPDKDAAEDGVATDDEDEAGTVTATAGASVVVSGKRALASR